MRPQSYDSSTALLPSSLQGCDVLYYFASCIRCHPADKKHTQLSEPIMTAAL
jgi:hypothetical protein